MSGGEFAAIEARASAASEGPWYVEGSDVRVAGPGVEDVAYDMLDHDAEFVAHARTDIPALLAAVRERDNTIARVRAVLAEYDALTPEVVPAASTHAWMHEVRAALDPQETH